MKATSLKLGTLVVGFGLSSLLALGCASEAGSETDLGSIAEEGLTGSFAVGSELQTKGEVNQRSSPSSTATILQVIPSGTRVKSAASQPSNGWYGVTWNGKTGWVAGTYLVKGSSAGAGPAQSSNGKGLTVPYLNQYDNATVNPGGSCGNTSTAMLLRFYGIQKTPDGVRTTYDGGATAVVAQSLGNVLRAFLGFKRAKVSSLDFRERRLAPRSSVKSTPVARSSSMETLLASATSWS